MSLAQQEFEKHIGNWKPSDKHWTKVYFNWLRIVRADMVRPPVHIIVIDPNIIKKLARL